MTDPDISPMLRRLVDDDYRSELKSRLEAIADETEDEAYASRLRLVARGERPLRTLLADPAWNKQFQPAVEALDVAPEFSQKEREVLDRRVAQARDRALDVISNTAEAQQDAVEIADRAERVRETIRQEEISGWTYVHPAADESEADDGGAHER
ncbi:hypothetical protein FHX48_000907 [Microbacterium halimionae]|uniref:Uncharacterized protein n=1 Tax=Microbacterium halimionae TaxID=1526413 RepID=A0A7W3JN42_9MICO|nr:hypothetical protein [Microbacterium halimionae]MBA8815855.1 hypothetical protein [Microbacterium halimionae]NII95901.1 hypothetical protein [Microbacterium halimionae]